MIILFLSKGGDLFRGKRNKEQYFIYFRTIYKFSEGLKIKCAGEKKRSQAGGRQGMGLRMKAMTVPLDEGAGAQLEREVLQGEYVPEDYFTRQSLAALFQREAPTEIDLGCGDGSFLIQMAEQYPERNFLGVERLLGRVQKVCKKAYRAGLQNVKVLRLESQYAVEWLLPQAAFSRVHLICPDPWPKEKHHKNRLMQAPFFQAVYDLLTPDGEFLFRTDHEEYYEWSLERMEAFPSFHRIPWAEEDFFYPKSDFQLQWEAEGKCLHNMRCLKQDL